MAAPGKDMRTTCALDGKMIRLCRCCQMIVTRIIDWEFTNNPPVEEGNEMLDFGHSQLAHSKSSQSHSGQGSQIIRRSHGSRKAPDYLVLGKLKFRENLQKKRKIRFHKIMCCGKDSSNTSVFTSVINAYFDLLMLKLSKILWQNCSFY